VRLCRSIARVCGVEVHDPLQGVRTPNADDRPPALPEDVQLIRTVELVLLRQMPILASQAGCYQLRHLMPHIW
jgi:hypothetical protein